MKFSVGSVLCSGLATTFAARIPYNAHPYADVISKRQSTTTSYNSTQVDLGYSVYQGYSDSTSGLNIFKGIRFAAAPTGSLRWQPPQPPSVNRSSVMQATSFASQCPQAEYNFGVPDEQVTEATSQSSSEDCLFLNVYTPQNATSLPVFVYIHGGGYGTGNGQQDMSSIINANNNGFIAVVIQYRLGAFGFLSSDELSRFGIANAGLRDQQFALQWTQSYIHLFGGNASHVTIAGESAGAGSVMLQAMANGGTLGSSLFTNAIVASPYLPMQYNYNDWVPSQAYYAFAQQAGCFTGFAAQNPNSQSIYQCLINKDSSTLIEASATISTSGMYGTWGFLPVTDGIFIQSAPSSQLLKKEVNGLRMLSGNNANEGVIFTPQNITTENDLVNWLQETFPLFTTDDLSKLLLYYPSSNATDTSMTMYATSGYTGATAVNESNIATGQQQRANDIYAETTFVCPSYWLAEAYTNEGRTAYKYQYSVLPGTHGTDLTAYFGPPAVYQGSAFSNQFMKIWGNFIMNDNPSVLADAYNGTNVSALASWPSYNTRTSYMMNLNQTGGTLVNATIGMLDSSYGEDLYSQFYIGPGLTPNFSLVDAFTWEGGRGVRCDFWRSVAALVPE